MTLEYTQEGEIKASIVALLKKWGKKKKKALSMDSFA